MCRHLKSKSRTVERIMTAQLSNGIEREREGDSKGKNGLKYDSKVMYLFG